MSRPASAGDAPLEAHANTNPKIPRHAVLEGAELRAELTKLRGEVVATNRVPEFNWGLFHGFLREYEGMAPYTIDNRMRQLRRMSGQTEKRTGLRGTQVSTVVALTGSVDDVLESFCAFREARLQAGAKSSAVRNDYAGFAAALRMLGIPRDRLPVCPTIVPKAKDLLPSPEDVFQLLHHDFGYAHRGQSYERALARHLLFLDFGVGVRFPSEAWMLRLHGFDPRNHILTVIEPKKGGKVRQLVLDPLMCCTSHRVNLANYVVHWRTRLDPDFEQDAFFLQPVYKRRRTVGGRPFTTKESMAKFLRDTVSPYFPWFHGYLGRTWHINARLLETGVQRDSGRWEYDWVSVANWVGHDNINTLRRYYDQFVDVQRQVHGTDWFARAFIAPRKSNDPPAASPAAVDVKAWAQARREAILSLRRSGRRGATPPDASPTLP